MGIRPLDPAEVDALARVWHDAWRDAHARIVPAAIVRMRTRERFRDRLLGNLGAVRVAGPVGAPIGFYMLKEAELDQLFVAASSRGTGVAQALIADAEERLAAAGVATAWLACAIGNTRAARFYEKCGWRRAGTVASTVDTLEGPLWLEMWRYEKRLAVSS
jgi:GNAT superfamily N-acetyltransferase